MNLRTTLLLLLVALGLGAVVWWQRGQEAADVHLVDERLFEGVDVARVTAIRVDNVYRSYAMRLERDAAGSWYLVDPISYPADEGFVERLLDSIGRDRVMVVRPDEADAEALGFEPPRIVLDVYEDVGGESVRHRVELGAPDLDGKRVHVRKDGRYFRALRTIYTTLDRGFNEFRSQLVMHASGRDVVEVRRSGSYQIELGEPAQDLTFNAFLDGGAWHSVLPRRALLSPRDVGVLVFGALRLQARDFVEDEARDLGRYGLDAPLLRLDLGLDDGATESLLLSRSAQSPWYAKAPDAPQVWLLEEAHVQRLLYPFEAMLERLFMTTRRGDVTALRLERGDEELRLERGAEDWTLRTRRGDGPWSAPVRADGPRVEDWLGRLETLEVARFLLDEPPGEARGDLAVTVETRYGEFGGRLGEEVPGEGDAEPLVRFQRPDDDLAALMPAWLAELARAPEREFLSLDLLALDEVRTTGLQLTGSAGEARFTRDDRGLWHRAGTSDEARDLLRVLDALLFLKAAEHLAEPVELADPVEVRFERAEGDPVSYRVGLGPDGATLLEVGAARARARRTDLHAELTALLGR